MNIWMVCCKFDAKIQSFQKGIGHLNFCEDSSFYQDNHEHVLDYDLFENAMTTLYSRGFRNSIKLFHLKKYLLNTTSGWNILQIV